MVFPLVAAGLVAGGTTVSSFYNLSKAYENRKFLNAYSRNTGVYNIKYPYRSGYNDIYRAYGQAMYGYGGTVGFGYSWYNSGYHPGKRVNFNYMYG